MFSSMREVDTHRPSVSREAVGSRSQLKFEEVQDAWRPHYKNTNSCMMAVSSHCQVMQRQ